MHPLTTYRTGACGGNSNTKNGLLSSPSFPEKYPHDTDCIYTITSPNDTVNIHFLIMDMDNYGCYDYIEIRDGDSEESPMLAKLCGTDIPDPIHSTQNQVWMR